MKKASLFLVMLTVNLGLISCSSEEIFSPEATTNNLLENYSVKRDATGAYSLDYTLNENAVASLSKDAKSNNNNFYVYSSDNQSKTNFREELSLNNNSLNVGFTDTETNKKSFITVIDDDIRFNRDANKDFLSEYSITNNGDDTVTMNFKVKENITADFVYNDTIGTYEVHLREGAGSQSDFIKTFVKEEGVDLKIDFVNHYANSETGRGRATVRKPRSIIRE
ncbi:MAG: hypothetical protein GKR88_04720 [Flavobacteriaceae bacterium]|nr:MAG: hypothetical protein GKR88_04720 [Flavobacteriaceae bacterium]